MKTLKLEGRLAKEFGAEFALDIASPAEGIRALCYQIPGFEETLKEGVYKVVRTYPDRDVEMGEDDIPMNFGKATGFRITPVVAGAKKKGLGKVILGVALVGAAFFFSAGTAAGMATKLGGVAGSLGLTYSNVAMMGTMMTLQGVSAMLAPNIESSDPSDQDASFLLDATGNLVEQGNPVPVVFGEVFTGSVVISSGLTAEEISDE